MPLSLRNIIFQVFYKIIAESDDDDHLSQGGDSDQDPAYVPATDVQQSDEYLLEDEVPKQRPVREPQMETVRGE